MKKLTLFSFFIVMLISLVTFFIFKPKNYQSTYNKGDYKVTESYNVKSKLYTFKILKDKNEYYFVSSGKYSIKRKIVSSIEEENNCITLKVDKYNLGTECLKDNNLVSKSIINKQSTPKKINTISRYEIYNDKYKYYAWNSYGLEDILGKSEHNFLNQEAYDNKLAYQIDNYIIFADYDKTHDFDTLYVFNANTNKYFSIISEEKISFDSYFMGDVKNKVYLFDRKNKSQYEINIDKKKILKISNEESIRYYNKGWKDDRIDKYVYNDIKFIYDDIYKYELIDNKLYLTLKGYNRKILVSNKKIKDIVRVSFNSVYYLVDTSLYRFNLVNGEELLITYFDWNFSYLNKIYIFD